jgi:hypothetical protein
MPIRSVAANAFSVSGGVRPHRAGGRRGKVGDAFQRMILANGTPETAYDEVVKAYNAALAKSR